MKILFINPPLFKREENIWRHIDSCTPPFGLAILAAILQENEIDVLILDCNALLIPLSSLRSHLPRKDFNFIGITATTALIHNSLETADICRKVYPNATIVLGGVHPTIMPGECLACPSVDLVIRGEGERSFLRLVSGESISTIPGISFRESGKIVNNPEDDEPVDLNENPIPAYHLLPMKRYHTALGSSLRSPNIGIISSRGCPGRCTFCYGHFFGKKVRYRHPQKIYEEILYLMKNHGIREMAFYDDTFTTNKQKVIELCELLLANRTDLTWSCFSRVDTVDLETLKIMKKAGCHQISVGIESASEKILKNIRKNISIDRATRWSQTVRRPELR